MKFIHAVGVGGIVVGGRWGKTNDNHISKGSKFLDCAYQAS